jgi:hypothetical protein
MRAMAMMMGNAARIARIKAITLTILKAEQRREEKDHAIKHRPNGRVKVCYVFTPFYNS